MSATSRWARLAFALIPREWRDTVAEDLSEEALRGGHGTGWIAGQALVTGASLRLTISGGRSMGDLQYVLRSLGRARWFTAGSILTFALGIGVNVVMFAAVDRMLFRALPYRDTASLVTLKLCAPRGCGGAFPANVAYQLKTASRTIDDVGTAGFLSYFSQAPDDEHPIELMDASPNLLRMLGVRPVIGRVASADEEAGPELFGWLAYDTWRVKFGADSGVVGRRLGVGKQTVTILGVLPKNFIPPILFGSPARWEGLVTARDGWAAITANGLGSVAAPVARLKPGVSISDVRAESAAVMAGLRVDSRGSGLVVDVQPLETGLFARYQEQLLMVSVPSILILLLACVNLSALLLLRSRAGEHTTAIRLAMGATRARIIKTALIESTVVCLAGAVVGVLALGAAGRFAKAYLPLLFVRNADSLFDARVLGVALATVMVSGLIAGLFPAWRLTRSDVRSLLSHSPRRAGRLRGGRFILAVESAIGCVLVLGAFVTVRSLVKLTTEDLGVNAVGLYDLSVAVRTAPDPRPASYEANFTREIEDALRRTPGVLEVGRSELLPFSAEAPPRAIAPKQPGGARYQLSSTAFEALGMTFLAGRPFTRAEEEGKLPVVVLSETAAHVAWPGALLSAVVGREWQLPEDDSHLVIGVVKDVKTSYGATSTTPNFAFVPLGSEPGRQYSKMILRTAGPAPSVNTLRALLEPAVGPVKITVSSAAENADRSVVEPRFRAGLFLVMALTGLSLLIAGLYATAGAEVAERRFEIGLRLALGATSASVSRHVLTHVLAPIAAGTAVGLGGAFLVARLVDSYLYRVDTRDPWSYGIVVGALLAVAAASAWPSARRAAKTDPAVVLRAQ